MDKIQLKYSLNSKRTLLKLCIKYYKNPLWRVFGMPNSKERCCAGCAHAVQSAFNTYAQ